MNSLIFGGNGFVGTHVAELLVRRGSMVTCASRSGKKPRQLEDVSWATQVTWMACDAGTVSANTLENQDTVISLIGAPPIPAIGKAAFQRSLYSNGEAVTALARATAEAGVTRLIVLGAKIPAILKGNWFAYAKGKHLAEEAAQQFAEHSDRHMAVLIQPGSIYGTRYSQNGYAIPLGLVMKPLASILPSQLVAVHQVAQCIADFALGSRGGQFGFQRVGHGDI